MLFCCYLINISKMNTSSDNEQESQEVLLTSNKHNKSSVWELIMKTSSNLYLNHIKIINGELLHYE